MEQNHRQLCCQCAMSRLPGYELRFHETFIAQHEKSGVKILQEIELSGNLVRILETDGLQDIPEDDDTIVF